jgi:hypothetical protein
MLLSPAVAWAILVSGSSTKQTISNFLLIVRCGQKKKLKAVQADFKKKKQEMPVVTFRRSHVAIARG